MHTCTILSIKIGECLVYQFCLTNNEHACSNAVPLFGVYISVRAMVRLLKYLFSFTDSVKFAS